MTATLTRFYSNDKQTLGELRFDKYVLLILEPAWKNNQRKISCIPNGSYCVEKRYSPRYGEHWHITDVPNRDLILIHFGNHFFNSEGCNIVGFGLKEINSDGELDVTESKAALKLLNDVMPDVWTIIVQSHSLPDFAVKSGV